MCAIFVTFKSTWSHDTSILFEKKKNIRQNIAAHTKRVAIQKKLKTNTNK